MGKVGIAIEPDDKPINAIIDKMEADGWKLWYTDFKSDPAYVVYVHPTKTLLAVIEMEHGACTIWFGINADDEKDLEDFD